MHRKCLRRVSRPSGAAPPPRARASAPSATAPRRKVLAARDRAEHARDRAGHETGLSIVLHVRSDHSKAQGIPRAPCPTPARSPLPQAQALGDYCPAAHFFRALRPLWNSTGVFTCAALAGRRGGNCGGAGSGTGLLVGRVGRALWRHLRDEARPPDHDPF